MIFFCYNSQCSSEDEQFFAVGVDGVEGPPVPIPNTVVKLNSAEDTQWEAAWENRTMPTLLKVTTQQGGYFFAIFQMAK